MSGSPPLTLVCFPHAGGGMRRYRQWRNGLPDGVEVVLPRLPGREGRLFQAPLPDVASVSGYVLRELAAVIDRAENLAFAGLSYGALVAYDLAARLEISGKPVRALFVASQRAPTRRPPQTDWHLVDDDLLAAELTTTGHLGPDLGDQEVRELFLPSIRADLHASEIYLRPDTHGRLRCPIFLCLGTQDASVPPSWAYPWRHETDQFSWHDIEAGHFLTGPDGEDLWFEALRSDLNLCLADMGAHR